jgi:hypothetical protein
VLEDSTIDVGDNDLFGAGLVDGIGAVEEAIDSRGFNKSVAAPWRKTEVLPVSLERLKRYYGAYAQ